MENEIVLKWFFVIGTTVMLLSVSGVLLMFIKYRGRALTKRNKDKHLVNFTERELEILQKTAEGMKPKEIAEALFISPRTVNVHKQNIQDKYQFDSIMSAVVYCIQKEIIVLEEK